VALVNSLRAQLNKLNFVTVVVLGALRGLQTWSTEIIMYSLKAQRSKLNFVTAIVPIHLVA